MLLGRFGEIATIGNFVFELLAFFLAGDQNVAGGGTWHGKGSLMGCSAVERQKMTPQGQSELWKLQKATTSFLTAYR